MHCLRGRNGTGGSFHSPTSCKHPSSSFSHTPRHPQPAHKHVPRCGQRSSEGSPSTGMLGRGVGALWVRGSPHGAPGRVLAYLSAAVGLHELAERSAPLDSELHHGAVLSGNFQVDVVVLRFHAFLDGKLQDAAGSEPRSGRTVPATSCGTSAAPAAAGRDTSAASRSGRGGAAPQPRLRDEKGRPLFVPPSWPLLPLRRLLPSRLPGAPLSPAPPFQPLPSPPHRGLLLRHGGRVAGGGGRAGGVANGQGAWRGRVQARPR